MHQLTSSRAGHGPVPTLLVAISGQAVPRRPHTYPGTQIYAQIVLQDLLVVHDVRCDFRADLETGSVAVED